MSGLAQLQRGLLSLLKGRPIETPANSYLQQVAGSKELLMAREVALWWRGFSLESYCVFTSRLLNRLGIFDQTIETYFRNHPTSSFIEELSQDFLAWLSAHDEPLVVSMAGFERALLRVKRGDSSSYQVEWNRNPESLFSAILKGTPLPATEWDRIYRTTISERIPRLVSCEVISKASAQPRSTGILPIESGSRAGKAPNSKVSCRDTRHVAS